jgi:hypothetical protein
MTRQRQSYAQFPAIVDMRTRKRFIAPDRIALVASIDGGEQGKIQIGGTLS